MKNPKKVTGSGFGTQPSVRAGENGFEKLHRRPDDERIVLEVMQEIKRIFQSHDLSFFNGQQVLLEQSVRQILNFERERPIVIPLPPGYGKSTLLRAMLRVLAREFAQGTAYAEKVSGLVIVVEKTAEAYQLRDLANRFSDNIAHVLEGPNDYNISLGKCPRPEVKNYADCRGIACPDQANCPIVQSKNRANVTPVLILLHARYQHFVECMTRFSVWTDAQGQNHARKLLLVDEAPSLMMDNRISDSVIARLTEEISLLHPSYDTAIRSRKQEVLYQITHHLIIPYRRLKHKLFLPDTQIALISAEALADAGFTEEGCGKLVQSLSKFSPAHADRWQQILNSLLCEPALFVVGQEETVCIPARKKPDMTLNTAFLSGSAMFSPELCCNPDLEILDVPELEQFSHLTIRVLQNDALQVHKTALQGRANRQALLCWLRHQLTGLSSDDSVLLVVYKRYAEAFWHELDAFHDRLIPLQMEDGRSAKASLPYFGGMNGSNRYAQAQYLICAGLGRFEMQDYLSRALAYDFDGSAYSELCQRSINHQLCQMHDLNCVLEMEYQTLARDLVQLFYRTALRNHGVHTPVTVWLINPPEPVLNKITNFFPGCTVQVTTDLPTDCLNAAASSRMYAGKLTHAAKVLQWLNGWDGSKISVDQICAATGLSKSQWKEARKNPAVRVQFAQLTKQKNGTVTYYSRMSADTGQVSQI